MTSPSYSVLSWPKSSFEFFYKMGQKNPKEPSGRSNSLGECYRRRNVNQLAQRTNSINAPRFRNVLDSSHLWLGAQGAQPQWWKGVYFTKGGRPSPRQHCCCREVRCGAKQHTSGRYDSPMNTQPSGLLKPGAMRLPTTHTHTLPTWAEGTPRQGTCFSGAAHVKLTVWEPETEASKDYRPDPVQHLSLLEPNQVFA